MLKEFTRRFTNYLIESKEEFLIYLIPGEIIKENYNIDTVYWSVM